jgi:hypothetical protein
MPRCWPASSSAATQHCRCVGGVVEVLQEKAVARASTQGHSLHFQMELQGTRRQELALKRDTSGY